MPERTFGSRAEVFHGNAKKTTGGLTKKDLPRGFTRKLIAQEIIMLKHFTGK